MEKKQPALASYPVSGQEDLRRLKSFLKENKLPFDDLRLEGNSFFLYVDGATIAGCGGLEFYGDHCLLRSVAVSEKFRGNGYGKEIVQDLVSRASAKPVQSISILTETAEKFFETNFGFRKQPREHAPVEIKTSSEFSSVCPVSAVFMSLKCPIL